MASPTIPGYESLTQIGKGGFSRVYRGEQAKLKRGVAIKVLNFGLNDEADRRSFERECELMGRVSTHPNIVTVHDTAFTADGQPCIVMEHYPGGSLADLISEVRRLSVKEVLEVGVAIAAALEASHQAGVLHCDLKPQNILISEFGQPALGDFGISTFSEERTRTGGDAGAGFTLAYAAPEIVEGASPSVESDVYSLAATLYTSLAGRRPFYYPGPNGAKPTAADQARRILLEAPASLADAGVPTEIDRLIRAAMAKDPASRPSSAAGFARSLYEAGQQLGLGTSSPRLGKQGALSVRDGNGDFTDQPPIAAEAPPAGDAFTAPRPAPAEASLVHAPAPTPLLEDATELRADGDETALHGRSDDATALRVEFHDQSAQQVAADAAPDQSPRKHRALIIGGISLLLVATVLTLASRGGNDADDIATSTPTPVVGTPQAEILLAPPPPTNVELQRAGSSTVVLSWSNEPADDITYEVSVDDRPGGIEFGRSPVLTNDIDPDDITCFQVTAIRGNRLSPAADRVCTEQRGDTYVEASPMVCETPCDVVLDLQGFEADTRVTVSAQNAADGSPVEVEYDDELRTDADGKAPAWRVQFDDEPLGAMYLIELTPEGGDRTYRAVTIVNPPSN